LPRPEHKARNEEKRNRCPESNALAEREFLIIKIGDPGKQHGHNAKHWVINKLVNRPFLQRPAKDIFK
jgi:hypothetical protein